MDISDLFQLKVNMSAEDLVAAGKSDLVRLAKPFAEAGLGPDEASTIIALFTAISVAADGEVSPEELAFFKETFGAQNLPYERFKKYVATHVSKEIFDAFVDMLKAAPLSAKADLLDYYLCICAIDGKITPDEQRVFKYLMGA